MIRMKFDTDPAGLSDVTFNVIFIALKDFFHTFWFSSSFHEKKTELKISQGFLFFGHVSQTKLNINIFEKLL